MKRLWAPWRMPYITGEVKEESCIFCTKPAESKDKDAGNLILYRGKYCFVIMNLYPYNNGHLMVVPYRHTNDLRELSDKETSEMMTILQKTLTVLERAMSPHGFNTGMNLGVPAGAGIDDHIHLHIVPRWNGDTNFMPTLTQTKVISEGLKQTWEKLKKTFEEIQ